MGKKFVSRKIDPSYYFLTKLLSKCSGITSTRKPIFRYFICNYILCINEDIALLLNEGHFGRHLEFCTLRMLIKNSTLIFIGYVWHIPLKSRVFAFTKNTRNYKRSYTTCSGSMLQLTAYSAPSSAIRLFECFAFEFHKSGNERVVELNDEISNHVNSVNVLPVATSVVQCTWLRYSRCTCCRWWLDVQPNDDVDCCHDNSWRHSSSSKPRDCDWQRTEWRQRWR